MKQLPYLSAILLASMSLSHAQEGAYQQGMSEAERRQNEAFEALGSIPLSDVPNYTTSNPAETNINADNIGDAAQNIIRTDENARFIAENIDIRDVVVIDEDDEILQFGRAVSQNPQAYIEDDTYCIDGACFEPEIILNDDIAHAAAQLNAITDAGNAYNATGTIFRGSQQRCRIENWGFANCCADSGWGVNIGLARCSSAHKRLGELKQAGVCRYNGDYTEGRWWNKRTTKSYCCFGSKLARLIHVGGRGQIGMGWGSAKSPNCGGFSPEQFQRLDLSRINLGEFERDIADHVSALEFDVRDMQDIPNRYQHPQ